MAADSTNGYVTAYVTLLRMRHPSILTPSQLQSVNALLDGVVQRLDQALQKGDPGAKEAAQAISQIDKNER